MTWKNPIDASRWNWTGPRIDPNTKKLQFLSTADLLKTLSAGIPEGQEMYSGTDEYGDYVGYRAVSGLPDSGHTENSTYPRSENRETTTTGLVKQANWCPAEGPVKGLRAVARIMSFAADGKAIVGQFHGEEDEPPVKVQAKLLESDEEGYVKGRQMYRLVPQHRPFYNGAAKTNDGKEIKDPVGPAWEVGGKPFDYDFNVTSDWVFNFESGGEKYVDQFDSASYLKYDPEWYRKAGMYSQTKAKTGKGVGDIRFYKLEMYDSWPAKPEDVAGRIEGALSDLLASYLSGSVPLKEARLQLNGLSTEIKAVKVSDPKRAEELNALAKEVTESLKL